MHRKSTFLNEKQVSIETGLSVSTLRAHRHQSKGLPYLKFGRRVLYDVRDIEAYLESCKVRPSDKGIGGNRVYSTRHSCWSSHTQP